ncbi:MAG: bifunctional (p)ppGpp synthetase/guanosine-3',5'-bis(diphosphate) 3'-pyrophosphohydrolase [Nitrospirae bacterium]|nr:bifunctional (p)ppGpp synthetase/guanosine-3',5'-bis(diphosphate) 3'-pyrophosphohydrolase [Nitrospirota bacterium]
MTGTKEVSTINGLIDKVFQFNPEADLDVLRRAYAYSCEAHLKQKRKGGEPFIEHPLAVANILSDMRLDSNTIAAGLLHDTVEDTGTTVEEVRDLFGDDIAFLVEGLTKLSKMELKKKEEAQAENFRKMFLAMAENIRVMLIKFADRLHNMRTLEHLPEDRRTSIAQETLEIYAPLANRLGIGWLKTEFEDLSFMYLMPDTFRELKRKVTKKGKEQKEYLDEIAKIVEAHLKEAGIPGRVIGRVKHLYGIFSKMQKQKIPFELVYDVIAIRIITDTKKNCYMIMGLIHSLWTPVPGRFKDFIGAPKSNLYQSLHTTVIGPRGEKIEFQIRTEDMNKIAEEGIAAHWKYKDSRLSKRRDEEYISWLRELVRMQKDTLDAREFLEAVKGDILPDVVYVFTPEGDIIELPQGSTPVDFAYSIHTEIGNHCSGAKVNGKIVQLRHRLENGDSVEILTSPIQKPSRDWLKFVKSQKAKARIRHWVKTDERKKSLELGKELIEKALKKYGLNKDLIKSKEIVEAVSQFKIKTHDDLFIAVGYGRISPLQAINKFLPEPEKAEPVSKKKETGKPKHVSGITVKGIDNIMFNRAKCCYPLPGEKVAGFVTRGRGVSIHSVDCATLDVNTIDADRLVDVEWSGDKEKTYPVKVLVYTIDKPGVLAEMSAVISSENVNLSHIDASATSDKKARFNFTMEVKDVAQLNSVIKKLSHVSGVIEAMRVKSR